MDSMTERKWQMRRLGSGDYLLPSNDTKTLWRLARYEDGKAHGLDVEWNRTFWSLHAWEPAYQPADLLQILKRFVG